MAFLEQLLKYDQRVQSKSLAVVPIYRPGILSKLLGRKSETIEYRSYLTQAGLPVVLPEKRGYRKESSQGATRSGVLLDESTALQLRELCKSQKLNQENFPPLNDGFKIGYTSLEIAQSLYGEAKYAPDQLAFQSNIFKQVIAKTGSDLFGPVGQFNRMDFQVCHSTDGSGQIKGVRLRYELSTDSQVQIGDRRFAELELVSGDNRQIKAKIIFGGQRSREYWLKYGQVVAAKEEQTIPEAIELIDHSNKDGNIHLDKTFRDVVESMICSNHNNARFHLHRLLNYGPSF